MEWGQGAWSGAWSTGEAGEDQMVGISECQAAYVLSNGEPLRVSDQMSAVIQAVWEDLPVAGMETEW